MGFKIRNNFYYKVTLPTGCSAACQIFERISDSIVWILRHHFGITNVVKVLDDFLFIEQSFERCNIAVKTFLLVADMIGMPIALEKTTEPQQVITFLGIELDSVQQVARLPVGKIEKYTNKILAILQAKEITLSALKSVIGNLSFCTSIVTGGRAFLRRLHNATVGMSDPTVTLPLDDDMREDLGMWVNFLKNYNGVHFFKKLRLQEAGITTFSDSCKAGFAAYYKNFYLVGSFPENWGHFNISVLEFFPIYLLLDV